MTLQYIREYYRVPAKRGGRIIYTGGKRPEHATIVRAQGQYLRVRFDGSSYTHPLPFHPTWEITYLAATRRTPEHKP